jgi:hypothetical protein
LYQLGRGGRLGLCDLIRFAPLQTGQARFDKRSELGHIGFGNRA